MVFIKVRPCSTRPASLPTLPPLFPTFSFSFSSCPLFLPRCSLRSAEVPASRKEPVDGPHGGEKRSGKVVVHVINLEMAVTRCDDRGILRGG